MTRWQAVIVLVFGVAASSAFGQGGGDASPPVEPAAVEPGEFRISEPTTLAFGDAGAHRWSAGLGVALNGGGNDYNAYGMAHFFVEKDFEFNLTVGAFYHDQDGEDAGSGNFAIGFRWHFVNDLEAGQSWYVDFGIGLLASSDDVPDGGTSFNFTPRAGLGTTIAIDGWDGARLDLGVRWHHISNANISGSDDNPDRDSLMVYAGVSWGF